ncbi:blue light sensor protein [Hymenobacter amundsenii]|uniref:Blue light sensor protein n=1 Tax=Hymenobacter amundsenii TaxID=2006685 RepID=A0A246FFT7_9BACT|nr:BLUF domain-containing protein [Hymenobacter amundsenii]OWP61382.1 blue light sensor protein [Hymenobacter amundsenii]
MSLYHLLYHSRALVPFDPPGLRALLEQARGFNREHHISGLLLHTPDGRFLQILEGEEAMVRALYYDHIVADLRHHRCQVLGAGPCPERSFADWNMGFRVANAAELRVLLAGTPAAGPGASAAMPPHLHPGLLKLLLDFVSHHALEPEHYL